MNIRTAFKEYAGNITWAGILLITASLPLSRFGISLGMFTIAGAWLLGGNLKEKLVISFRQPVVWILWGVYFWIIFGLWNTSDFALAKDDLRIKLPLFLMPLFLSSSEKLTVSRYRILIAVFIGGVLISTLISLGIYLGWSHIKVNDIRDITPFLSHIRLALMICFCIVGCIWFFMQFKKPGIRILILLIIGWFLFFLNLLESLTGIAILTAGAAIYFIYLAFRKGSSIFIRVVCSILLLVIVFGSGALYKSIFVDSIIEIHPDLSKLPDTTALGNKYTHQPNLQDMENGNLVWLNVCDAELDSAWKKRTGHDLSYMQHNGYEIRYTIMRFIASKGLKADASAVNALNDEEINAIMKGTTNVKDMSGGSIGKRIRDLAYEYRQYYFTKDPSGHSLTMRLEFWKAGIILLKKHPLAGVGTGDIKPEYDKTYLEMKSKLEKRWQYVTHNQYLRTAVVFGIPGALYFLFSLFYPWFKFNLRENILYTSFLFIILCSMLTEDTIETSTGATLFAFMNSILIFNAKSYQDVREGIIK